MLIEEGLWGWDPTPGILSVWAEGTGRAIIWRRMAKTGELVREEDRFRPWVLLARRDDVPVPGDITCRELAGPGELRYLVSASDLLRFGHCANSVRSLRSSCRRRSSTW